jgi:hypothetical protein
VVRAVKLCVVVKEVMYCVICNNYGIIEHNLQRVEVQKVATSHPYIHINICNIKIWLNNTKEELL